MEERMAANIRNPGMTISAPTMSSMDKQPLGIEFFAERLIPLHEVQGQVGLFDKERNEEETKANLKCSEKITQIFEETIDSSIMDSLWKYVEFCKKLFLLWFHLMASGTSTLDNSVAQEWSDAERTTK